VWQGLYQELGERGFVVISVAVDRSAEAARPWIEAARPTHPALIDTRHRVADLYNMVNVPTVVWIDERGRIARPNDVAFGTNTFRQITGIDAARHQAALRAWVTGAAAALPEARTRELLSLPTPADQQARAEFGLGQWLHEQGRSEAASRHFVRGSELAPHDFMIRRGTMPIRGIDPMGPQFRTMLQEWTAAGHRYYVPLPD
jgi:hypothetical protein